MATLVVTTLDDEVFDGPETEVSPDGNGLSLREALSLAGADDTITFDEALAGGTLTLTNGEIFSAVMDSVTLDGDIDNDGTADITIDANGVNRHFVISGSDSTDFIIEGLKLTGGSVADDGGSINLRAGNLTIKNSVFFENEATGGSSGGAISTGGRTSLQIYNTIFSDNSTEDGGINGSGGAIVSLGELFVHQSTFQNNSAGGAGGAIENSHGQMTIVDSTFIGNSAGLTGGAVTNYGGATFLNSTFVGNKSYWSGGAIYSGGTKLSVESSTFTGNYGSGGAIYSYLSADDFMIANSILSGNESAIGPDNLWSTSGFTNLGGNIIGSNIYAAGVIVGEATLAEIFNRVVRNENTNIYSGQLDEHGGLVQTVMINPNGAALDRGYSSILSTDVLDLDQDQDMGERVPVDGNGAERISNGALDVGSVELKITNGTNSHNVIDGDHFTEVINGHEGHDTLRGLDGHDTIDGGAGQDLVYGNMGDDLISGRDSNDDLRGSIGDDTVYGDQGEDYIRGNSNDDDLRGGAGNDTLDGGLHNDVLRGASGNDVLYGRVGKDVLLGGKGNDLLLSHDGNDVVHGEFGNDTMSGGAGNDLLYGGEGDDRFIFALGDGADMIFDFTTGPGSEDEIEITGFGAPFDNFAEILAAARDDGRGNAVIDFGGGDSITLNGLAVSDLHQDDFVFG